MIVLNILLIIICFLLTILLMVLFIPFGYKIHAESFNEKKIRFKIYWLFGLVGFLGEYVFGQEFNGSINLFGFNIAIKNKDVEKKKKDKKTKDKDKKKKNKLSGFSRNGVLTLLKDGFKAIKHILPNKIEGYARFGLDDPYNTSVICSVIEATRGIKMHDLDLEYVFDYEVYEGKIDVEGRIICIYFVYIIARLYLNRSTRKILIN